MVNHTLAEFAAPAILGGQWFCLYLAMRDCCLPGRNNFLNSTQLKRDGTYIQDAKVSALDSENIHIDDLPNASFLFLLIYATSSPCWLVLCQIHTDQSHEEEGVLPEKMLL